MTSTIQSDQQALLAAILDKPEDDLVRLVYSDWLEEHGQEERAEFIRVQIELANIKCTNCGGHGTYVMFGQYDPQGADVPPNGYIEHCLYCNAGELKQKQEELLRGDYGRNWRHWGGTTNEMIPGACYFYDHVFFRRGFVNEVKGHLNSWLTHGPAIVREHPIEVVRITDKRPVRIDSEAIEGWKQYRFVCYPGISEDRIPDYLPFELRRYLTGRLGGDAIYYDNLEEEAAHTDLSQALIKWAKCQ